MFAKEIVVLDTEYTSWEGCIDRGWNEDEGEYKEIVQVAAIKLDGDTFEEVDAFNETVRPQINPELSEYFVELTGIQQEAVDGAREFEAVARAFNDWAGDRDVYCYGRDDVVLRRNVELYDSSVEFDAERFNDVRHPLEEAGVPVDEHTSGTVCEFFDAEVGEGSAHDALYDCRSIREALKETYQ